MTQNDKAEFIYDLRGQRCPHLLITVIAAVREQGRGVVLEISADDLNAPSSISAWARQSGCELLDMYDDGHVFTFLLRTPEKRSD